MRRSCAADVRRKMAPDAGPVTARRRGGRALLVVAFTCLVMAGCGSSEISPETEAADAVYVEYMAALQLAVDEGLAGEEAEARVVELGAEPLSRDEVDGHVQRLSRDPIRWSRLEEQVEERAEELRREARPRPASSDEPRGAVVTE